MRSSTSRARGSWFRRGRTQAPPPPRPMTLDELREVDPRRAWDLLHRYGTRQVDDPWAVLGVEPGTDWDTITEAHRTLVKQLHPDLPQVEDPDAMVEVNVAYRELARFYGREGVRPWQ